MELGKCGPFVGEQAGCERDDELAGAAEHQADSERDQDYRTKALESRRCVIGHDPSVSHLHHQLHRAAVQVLRGAQPADR